MGAIKEFKLIDVSVQSIFYSLPFAKRGKICK